MTQSLLDQMNDDTVDSTISQTVATDNLLDSMTDEGASAWVPEEPGEGIMGKVISFREDEGDYGVYMVVTLETEDGDTHRVLGFGTVLDRELRDANPEPGDTIAIKYFGKGEVKKGKWAGKPYGKYKVRVVKG